MISNVPIAVGVLMPGHRSLSLQRVLALVIYSLMVVCFFCLSEQRNDGERRGGTEATLTPCNNGSLYEWECQGKGLLMEMIQRLFIFIHISCLFLAALVDLYAATRGQRWKYNLYWMSGDPCVGKWFGVYCNSLNTSVDMM